MEIEKYLHWGKEVAVISGLRGKHRDHCLCWQGCIYFDPIVRSENCPLANELYEYDVKHGMVTPVWECPKYERSSK